MAPCAPDGANCPRGPQQYLATGRQRGAGAAAGAPSPGAALSLPPPPLGPRPGMMRRGPPQQPLQQQQQQQQPPTQQQPSTPKRSLRLFPPGQGAWLEGPSREFVAGAPQPAQARLG